MTRKPVRIRLDSTSRNVQWTTNGRLFHCSDLLLCDAFTGVTTYASTWDEDRAWQDPLEALHWLETSIRSEPAATGRWVGYLSYDVGRLFEADVLPAPPSPDPSFPLFAFALVGDDEEYLHLAVEAAETTSATAPMRSTFTRPGYERAVRRVIDYIAAGDIFQVNLSQRFTASLSRSSYEIYQRLLDRTPATHGAFLDFGDFAVVSNSPELFVRVTPDRRVITRPIKGTRPRGEGMEAELRDSKKDQAELAMIVDLERNDLGRVCEIGSVKVVEPRVIEAHPTVYHGVATIEGKLREDVTFVDLLRATFPSGSVTGAPKIRAMQVIDELEPVRRGPYCGAIGYLAADGTIEFNVAIRTMIAKDGLIHIPVGGGIVADSDPAAEYEETLVKARAMFAAVGIS